MSNHSPLILLVDDEPTNLILLEELLQSQGYKIQLAASGFEALTLSQQIRPDLILLDIMMPEMNGFEVCKKLRQDPNLKTVPIFFLTALDDDQSRFKGLEIMGDDYITKPFNSRLLLAKIASTLNLSQMRTQVTQGEVQQQIKEQTQRQLAAAKQINEYLSEKFRLFVPNQFLERIAPKGIESIQLGNITEAELTVLFCDIRGFTAIAESQQARTTFEWLNAFFNQMSHAIESHQGFIDKFLGDAIMAVFDQEGNHGRDAVAAAIMMQEQLKCFNESRDQYQLKDPINIGIGIDTGIGTIGTLGSTKRMDSTVIGDVVNTASRLEGLTKIYGCQIIISEFTLTQLEQHQPQFYYRWIDHTTPRGKQQAINLYEILGSTNHLISELRIMTQPIFEKGVQAWKAQKLAAALGYFQQVLEKNSTDTVASLYRERCQRQLGLMPEYR